jgi:hypothetical protein
MARIEVAVLRSCCGSRGRRLVLMAALTLMATEGCRPAMPRTYPVKGRVVWKGGKAVRWGRIEFQSLTDSSVRATGWLGEDGTFALTTHREGRKAPGAIEGTHKVVIETSPVEERPPLVIEVETPYAVRSAENDFTIEIQLRRR